MIGYIARLRDAMVLIDYRGHTLNVVVVAVV